VAEAEKGGTVKGPVSFSSTMTGEQADIARHVMHQVPKLRPVDEEAINNPQTTATSSRGDENG
jgi:hypothetical protein